MPRRLLLTVLLLALAGCGFHLRGANPLPESASRVFVSAPNVFIAEEIEVFLRDGGAEIVSSREQANAILSISAEQYDKRVLSVDPNTGKEREFELSYVISYDLLQSDGTVLVRRNTVALTRDFVFDEDAVIGKSREESVLRTEMRRDAAERVIFQLNAALSNAAAAQ